MASIKMDDATKEAHQRWWREITQQGDPMRRPNISTEAFAAGYTAERQRMSAAVEGAQRIVAAHEAWQKATGDAPSTSKSDARYNLEEAYDDFAFEVARALILARF